LFFVDWRSAAAELARLKRFELLNVHWLPVRPISMGLNKLGKLA